MIMPLARAEISVEGLVQGVGYRAFVKRSADRLGLKGYAENMPDGSVHIVVEGERESIERLIESCWEGPPLSQVLNVSVSWGNYRGEFVSFTYY